MINPDISALRQLPNIFWSVLRLDIDSFVLFHTLPDIRLAAWLFILSAGLSEALGQSIILFLNRVKPQQFFKALLSVGFSLSLGLGFWLLSNWFMVNLVFGAGLSWRPLGLTLAFACAPLLFSFLTAMPYLGVPVFFIVGFWSCLAMTTGLEAITDLSTKQALACVVLGYVFLQLFNRTIGRPVVALAQRMEAKITGVELKRGLSNLYDLTQSEAKRLERIKEYKKHEF